MGFNETICGWNCHRRTGLALVIEIVMRLTSTIVVQ
jgi:hypothetical protein